VYPGAFAIMKSEEAVGGVKLLKPSVTFSEADAKGQTVFADMMRFEAAKSSLLLSLLKFVSNMEEGWDPRVSPARQSLKKTPAE